MLNLMIFFFLLKYSFIYIFMAVLVLNFGTPDLLHGLLSSRGSQAQ